MHQVLHHDGVGAASLAFNMDRLLFGRMALQRMNVSVTPNITEQGGGIVMLCHDLDQDPARDVRVAISGARATIWRETTGRELEAALNVMREKRQEYYIDTPVLQLRLEGVFRDSEITSRLQRHYRVTVFEVARWFHRAKGGGTIVRGQPVSR